MKFKKFVNQVQIGDKIKTKRKEFKVLTHIVWRQGKLQTCYNKYVLEDIEGVDRYRLFISDDFKFAGLGVIFEHDFKEPMPKKLEYEGEKYEMVQNEFCVAEQVEGDSYYKTGDCEIWWDYEKIDDSNTGLSLGRDWDTWEREDLKTTYIDEKELEII